MSCGYLFIVALFLHLTVFPTQVSATQLDDINTAVQKATPREGIKEGFDSWSLFLVCNPAWIHNENRERLLDLYHQFEAFGKAIGGKNLAVWFWKHNVKSDTSLTDNVDVERCSQYCAKFKLLPSEGPHIVVTTTLPDLGTDVGNYFVLTLNNSRSSDITALLNKLTDQIVVQGLNQAALDSEQYWCTWQRTFETVRGSLANFIKKVKLTIDTKFFKIEIDGGRS